MNEIKPDMSAEEVRDAVMHNAPKFRVKNVDTTTEPIPDGFARFNRCPTLCVDLPDGFSTISVRTSNGNMLTFGFCPYEGSPVPRCMDVVNHAHHRNVKEPIDAGTAATFPVMVRSGITGTVLFSSNPRSDKAPATIVILPLRGE